MKKLVIQIPCLNEEETLPLVIEELPRVVKGFDKVEWLVINDGSSDKTEEVAERLGVDHVVGFIRNRGLAKSFQAGLNKALECGADVIVNIDGDNQYSGKDIEALVEPILEGSADIVIGERPIMEIKHFSFIKKRLQKIGSWLVRRVSRTNVPDAPSGFRAFSKEAAIQLNVFNDYTYTLETIIQAGQKNLLISSVPIRVNGDFRKSRLLKNSFDYIRKSLMTIARILVVYRPYKFFTLTGLFMMLPGFLLGVRFVYYYFTDGGEGHIQSLILASLLIGGGLYFILIAFIADLLAVNRKLIEDVQTRVKKIEIGENGSEKS